MLRVIVGCKNCNVELSCADVPSIKELGPAAATLLIEAHACVPHCPHTLTLNFDGEVGGAAKEVIVRCIKDQCDGLREIKTTVPIELVPAMVVLMHTSHEGHPLELVYDDVVWRSPV